MRSCFGCALFCALLLGWTSITQAQWANDSGTDSGYSDYFDSCCECIDNWRCNTLVWTGFDTFKSIGDRLTNINGGTGSLTDSFGVVGGINTGFALFGDSDIRGQIGASYGIYDFMGRLALVPSAVPTENQTFVTTGLYKRGDILQGDAISWGMVFDYMHGDQWGINANSIHLGQFRGIFGYALNDVTEVGVFGTFNAVDDRAAVTTAGAPGVLTPSRAMNQGNVYLKKNTITGCQLMAYTGVMDSADIAAWHFGFNGLAPVSNYLSLYGNFNYVVPSASQGPIGSGQEQFDVSVGLVYYFGGKAASPSVTGNRGLPLLPVANNGSFLVTD